MTFTYIDKLCEEISSRRLFHRDEYCKRSCEKFTKITRNMLQIDRRLEKKVSTFERFDAKRSIFNVPGSKKNIIVLINRPENYKV